jgi:methyl coenzyme M reductase subunit D
VKRHWMVALVMVAALALPVVARAHGGHLHKALGTIASVQGEHVEIKTTAGKTIVVMLDKKTTVTRGKDTLDVTALRVGERISVDYMEANKMMMAHAIKLGTSPAPRK